jgi:hypothetical protein
MQRAELAVDAGLANRNENEPLATDGEEKPTGPFASVTSWREGPPKRQRNVEPRASTTRSAE